MRAKREKRGAGNRVHELQGQRERTKKESGDLGKQGEWKGEGNKCNVAVGAERSGMRAHAGLMPCGASSGRQAERERC